jgi:DNA polymerase elongation subunit (family B)
MDACFFDLKDTKHDAMRRLYLVDATTTYSTEHTNGPITIHLFTKSECGESVVLDWIGRTVRCYVRWPDETTRIDEWAELLRSETKAVFKLNVVHRTHLMGFEATLNGNARQHKYVELVFHSLSDRRIVSNALRHDSWFDNMAREKCIISASLDIWHHDLCAVQQALVAANGAPCMWISVPVGKQSVRDVLFHSNDDTPAPTMRILSYDIETCWAMNCLRPNAFPQVHDPSGRIMQVGMVYTGGADGVINRVLCLGDTAPVCGVDTMCFSDESSLLSAWGRDILNMDPDCITGFNIHGFDVGWLAGRASYIAIMNRFTSAEEAIMMYHWACGYMNAFPDKKTRPEIVQWIRDRKETDVHITHWDPSEYAEPDTTARRIAVYESEDQVREAWAYFHSMAPPSSFWCVGRCGGVSKMKTTIGRQGQDQQRFDMLGRITVDIYAYVKENYNNVLRCFSLKETANHFIKDESTQKIDLPYFEMFERWCSGCPRQRSTIAEYCIRDCAIPATLCTVLNVFPGIFELARVTGVTPYTLTRRGQQVRCLAQLYRVCYDRDVVINVRRQAQSDSFQGAIVQEPIVGYYDKVVIYQDFAALYPNIIRAWNLCYSTYIYPADLPAAIRAHEAGNIVIKRFEVGGGRFHYFVQQDNKSQSTMPHGIIPTLLNRVLNARAKAKADMKNADNTHEQRTTHNCRQLALKTTANSMYGFCGAKPGAARLPLNAIAETVTAQGRYLITMCGEIVPRVFPDVTALIYGDTDSCIFVTTHDCVRRGYTLGIEVQDYLNNVVLSEISRFLIMECEEVCLPFVQVAKKRYIAMAYENGPDGGCRLQVKGVEIVRKDVIPFCVEVYSGIANIIFPKTGPPKTIAKLSNEITDYILSKFKSVLAREYPVTHFAQTKTLQNITRYKQPDKIPWVRLACKINARIKAGELARVAFIGGDSISYIIRRGKGGITNRVDLVDHVTSTDDLDMLHYIDTTQRALNKITRFFIAAPVEDALYQVVRNTLVLRQSGTRSLMSDNLRMAGLHGDLDRARRMDECKPKKRTNKKLDNPIKQRTLIMMPQS